jgi:hypothetical protein
MFEIRLVTLSQIIFVASTFKRPEPAQPRLEHWVVVVGDLA